MNIKRRGVLMCELFDIEEMMYLKKMMCNGEIFNYDSSVHQLIAKKLMVSKRCGFLDCKYFTENELVYLKKMLNPGELFIYNIDLNDSIEEKLNRLY